MKIIHSQVYSYDLLMQELITVKWFNRDNGKWEKQMRSGLETTSSTSFSS